MLRWLSKRAEIGLVQQDRARDLTLATARRPLTRRFARPDSRSTHPPRAYFEPRFGRDLSRVRLHTGERDAESARGVRAAAYTVGQDIVFGAGKYAPQTGEGRRMLAHEIVHTLQQGSAAVPAGQPLEIGQSGDAAVQEAARIVANVTWRRLGIAGLPRRRLASAECRCASSGIVGTQDLPAGRFAVNFKAHDAAEAADAGANFEDARAGERGTITFTPDASAPQSNQIRFLQVARLTQTASGELNEFRGAQAPLNEMRSQPGEYAEGGYVVDVHPDPESRRTRKSDLPVEPFYNSSDRSGRSRVTAGNKMGSNSAGAVSAAVLEDHPRSSNPLKYELISTAKAGDPGAWYGSVFWGFEIFIENGKARSATRTPEI